MVWKKMFVEEFQDMFSAWLSLMCECGDFNYSESPCCRKPSIKFLIKRKMVWKKMLVEEFKMAVKCMVIVDV